MATSRSKKGKEPGKEKTRAPSRRQEIALKLERARVAQKKKRAALEAEEKQRRGPRPPHARGQGAHLKYDPDEMIRALKKHKGLVTRAAEEIGCASTTVLDYMKRFPAVQAAREDSRRRQLDVAEHTLFNLIDQGHYKAVRFFLSTQGRERGYITEKHVSVSGEIHAGVLVAPAQISVDQWEAVAQKVLARQKTLAEENDALYRAGSGSGPDGDD